MKKEKLSYVSLFSVCLLSLMLLALIENYLPFAVVVERGLAISDVAKITFTAMYPSDGDYWTEQTPDYWSDYPGMDSSWVTSDAQYGTYSLNATHTHVTSSTGSLYLILPSQADVSSYEYLFCRMKLIHTQEIPSMLFYIQNLSTWDYNKPYLAWGAGSGYVPKNVWFNVAVALHNGKLEKNAASQKAILQQFRYLWIWISFGAARSKATVLVDGLRFCNVTMDIQPNYSEQAKLNNVVWWVERAERTVTFNGKDYTILWDGTNITSGEFSDHGLESEASSQIINGYMLAYQYSGISYFLGKSEEYVQLMLATQDQSGVGYIPDKRTALPYGTATYAGWQLCALSQLYGQTKNSTYKSSADGVRHFIVDYLWDDENVWMDIGWNNITKTISDSTVLNFQKTGSCISGLAMYYYHVAQNSSVKNVIDKFYNKTLADQPEAWVYKESSWHLTTGSEDTSYTGWGYYYAGEKMNNDSYKQVFYDVVLRNFEQEVLQGLQDRCFPNSAYHNYPAKGFHNWGATNNVASITLAYNAYPSRVYGIVETALYDLFVANQSKYGWAFSATVGTGLTPKLWIPMAGYIASATQFYFNKTSLTKPTVVFSTGNITDVNLTTDKLTITVYKPAGKKSTLKVHCGNKGEPKEVSGASSWSYNSATKICALTVTHSSSQTVILDWSPPPPPPSVPEFPLDSALYIAAIPLLFYILWKRKRKYFSSSHLFLLFVCLC